MTSIIKVQNIQYTDGDAALTIADGGGVTAASTLTTNDDLSSVKSTGGNINLTTNSQPGSSGSPLNMDINFKGYNNNVMAIVRSHDESSSTGHGELQFHTTKNGVGTREVLNIDHDGNANVKLGNLVIGTAGKGIDFSASSDGSGSPTVSAEVLTDYEEGDWSPALTALGTSGSTINFAKYTRIGRTVHIVCHITFVSNSDGSAIQISNLPFDGNNSIVQSLPTPYSNYTSSALIPIVQSTTIWIGKSFYTADATYSDVSGKFVRMSGTYQILG